MASSLRSFTDALLFVIMFMATEMGTNTIMVTEAKNCPTPSARFKGPCIEGGNCAPACKAEGFPDGDCKGFKRQCFWRRKNSLA
ncbi:PREDICTED: defensin-like protein [Ipomoea nil]|uniref:defensin-like protein n=1 Tax=Ipomoea nil TaxID=35883 RepID=UPI000900BDCC|nr:PREDICTED: defensin-like protein [Ipomoea nil]